MQAGKYFLLSFSMLFFSQILYAQAVQTKEPNYRDPVLDRQFGIVGEVKAKPASVEGTYYLEESWNAGNIYLTSNDTIKGYPLKYDIERNQIEIKTQQDIKVLIRLLYLSGRIKKILKSQCL